MNTKMKAHVVFGLDKEGKPRAALVHPADLEAATKAATALGLKIGRADSAQAETIAKRLPDAKLFATGKGLVPLVRKDIYDWITKGLVPIEAGAGSHAPKGDEKDAGTPAAAPASSQPAKGGSGSAGAKEAPPARPDPTKAWDQLTVGSQVIAPEKDPTEDGWWPATVVAVSKDKSKLTLRWLDSPKLPPVTRKRHAVALLLNRG